VNAGVQGKDNLISPSHSRLPKTDIIRANGGKVRRIMPDPAPVHQLPTERGNVTNLLLEWGNGDGSALQRLTPIIYQELLQLARARLSHESRALTLQPTALVHECYLRLAGQTRLRWQNRAHFYAVAANTMRRVLIDHARKPKANKRGHGVRITLQTGMDVVAQQSPDLLALEDALQRLADLDERKSRVIELKYFGGMTTQEIGLVLGISVATVGRELRLGQALLRREMTRTRA
jgi:RNA polymerase sigma factor (TIGR02999 family)